MKNIRQKINQLRVAYFMPTTLKLESTSASYTPSTCRSVTPNEYGSYRFASPVVPFVGQIIGVEQYKGDNVFQSVPCAIADSPFAGLPNYVCTPRYVFFENKRQLCRVLDFSAYMNSGYRFFHHNYPSTRFFYHNQYHKFGVPNNIYF